MKLLSRRNGSARIEKAPATSSRWNTLVIRPRKITMDVVESAPFGPWSTHDGRTCSIGMAPMDGEVIPWLPSIHTVSTEMEIKTPADLYDVLDWRSVRAVYATKSNLLDKINTGLMLGLVCILGFFVFLLFSEMTTA